MVDYYSRTGDQYNSWHCNCDDKSSHNYAVREILNTMQKMEARTLLDVCCGTGRAVRVALDRSYDAKGLDITPRLLEIAKTDLQIPADRLVLGDATKLPFEDNCFDVVCILGALHHSAQPHRIISEMIRVAKRAIIISDEANHLGGGIKQLLIRMRLFRFACWVLRRSPRSSRRTVSSDGDGPTFVFSVEEIIPTLRSHFSQFRCLTFYKVGSWQICSYKFPRLFAKQCVVVVSGKK
jgi:SAM-dependent methyltransferase